MNKKLSVPASEVKERLLQDAETRREYDAMDAEYRLVKEIIKARVELGLTQAQLAERIGTKQSNISRLEGGNYNPTLEFLQKVADGLEKELHISIS